MTETNDRDRALPDMPETSLTCAQIEEGDYEARYLSNRLQGDHLAAYEAHYFGCDRCWAALRRATAVRAALASRRSAGRWARWALPAAAVLAAVGVWQLSDRAPDTPAVVLRGAADSMPLSVVAGADSLRAVWPRFADADVYRVRGFAADGSLRWSMETADTTAATARNGAVRVDVAALDRARIVIAQSALVAAAGP